MTNSGTSSMRCPHILRVLCHTGAASLEYWKSSVRGWGEALDTLNCMRSLLFSWYVSVHIVAPSASLTRLAMAACSYAELSP